MIARTIEEPLREAATLYPVVTLTGPRQSGKTTTCRRVFQHHAYVSLEAPDVRSFAIDDPRGFLRQFPAGVILDEVQNTPDLLSYIQGIVDEDPEPGRFVLTGSQHFALSGQIAQSLAGRTAVLHLLPPSREEVLRFDHAPTTLWETLFHGAYPRILDRGIPPRRWLADYMATYVERDVRQVLQVGDLAAFTNFVRLAAGRSSAELNLSLLGADAGVSHNTAKAWLSVLETSFLVFRAPAFHVNFRKRRVKAPKVHFVDSGLVCYLLGIESPAQLVTHPLRGAVFESWVASEIYKARLHRGLEARISHLRLTRGLEVDLIVEAGPRLIAVEAKSGATAGGGFFKHLGAFAEEMKTQPGAPGVTRRVVYGGDEAQLRSAGELIPWAQIQSVDW
ncbi:MAG: ATP-binding protein [Deltaproteobacteria bacterium]|nr:ATP-binding protein [Deltaproteobacteria bacterium]